VMPLLILALAVLLFLLFLIFQWRRQYGPMRKSASDGLTPVDLNAFENLMDLEEEEYLRLNLSPKEFRSVQRERIRVARLYVATISKNASMLVGIGQAARSQSDPELAASGQELMRRAVQLKIWCVLAQVRLGSAFLFPAVLSPSSAIAGRYMAAKHVATNLFDKNTA
jgi:hypothetical protein